MTYDSSKQYTWGPEDIFQIKGKDLGLMLNAIRAILHTEQAAQIILADKANNIIEGIIAEHVETGVVVEVPPEETTTS